MQVRSIGFRQEKIPDTSNPNIETVLIEITEQKAVEAKKPQVLEEEFSLMLKSRLGLHPKATQKQVVGAIRKQCLRK